MKYSGAVNYLGESQRNLTRSVGRPSPSPSPAERGANLGQIAPLSAGEGLGRPTLRVRFRLALNYVSLSSIKFSKYSIHPLIIFLTFINLSQCFSQIDSLQLIPTKDNSIFSESNTLSDGKGLFLYAGRTNNSTAAVRRALLRFDVSGVPANAQIQSVKLTLTTLKSAGSQTTPHDFTLHKVLTNWGEGTSNGSGAGATATINDATWQNTFYPSSNWTTNGGDFVSTASATAVGIYSELIVWTSPQMLTDVMAWLANPITNFGWLIKGQENVQGSAKAFASREGLSFYPRTLTIIYTIPLVEKAYINEVNPQKRWVEIYNPNKPTINLANYWLANENATVQINNSLLLNGNLSLDSAKYAVLNWSGMSQNDGELALYNGNPTIGGTLMKDYVQYGSANHQRTAAAVTAQVWNSGTAFLPTITADTSSYAVNGNNNYTSGTTTNSTDYVVQRQTPSIKNLICPTAINLSGNIIDAKYTTTGQLKLIGNLSSLSIVKFFSPQFIDFFPNSMINKGAFFEVKIGGCGSN